MAVLTVLAMVGFFLAEHHWDHFIVVAFFTVPSFPGLWVLVHGAPFSVSWSPLPGVLVAGLLSALLSMVYYALMLLPSWVVMKKLNCDSSRRAFPRKTVLVLTLLQLALVAAHVLLVIQIRDWFARVD